MSIQFHLHEVVPSIDSAIPERERCALVVEGLPLGYRNEDEHEVLENFARKVAHLIRSGVKVTKSID